MRKIVYAALATLVLVGCGGGGGGSSAQPATDNSSPLVNLGNREATLADLAGSYAPEKMTVSIADAKKEYSGMNVFGSVLRIVDDPKQPYLLQIVKTSDMPKVIYSICDITDFTSSTLRISCIGEDEEQTASFDYENDTLTIRANIEGTATETYEWKKSDFFSPNLDKLERARKQYLSLERLAGKTITANYHYLTDKTENITLGAKPFVRDIDFSVDDPIYAGLAGTTDKGEIVFCADMKDAPSIGLSYEYVCAWDNILGSQEALIFNLGQDGEISGGYEYALSSQNIFLEALKHFDAKLTDSFLH